MQRVKIGWMNVKIHSHTPKYIYICNEDTQYKHTHKHKRSTMVKWKTSRERRRQSADRTNNVGKMVGWMDVWWVICQPLSKYHLMADIVEEINCRRHLCTAQINFIHLSTVCMCVCVSEWSRDEEWNFWWRWDECDDWKCVANIEQISFPFVSHVLLHSKRCHSSLH